MYLSEFFKDKLDLDNLEYCSLNTNLSSSLCKSVSEVYVKQGDLTDENWSSNYNKDILFYLVDRLSLKNINRKVPKSLSFVAHKSVIKDLRSWFWRLYSLITEKFGGECIYEELIIKLYFCMRDDLYIISSGANVIIKQENQVSVVVTARNYGRFLKECLDSCLNQSIKPFEVIYSDDGSSDNSVQIAESFSDIKVIRNKKIGVCAARNKGVSISSGNILIHVDGDDILTYDFIQKHLLALNKNINAPFVYGPAQQFGISNYYMDVPKWGERFFWDQNFCNTSSAIRREYFDAVSGWKDCPGGIFWDWNLFLRISRYGNPAPSEAMLLYRRHNNSCTKKGLSKIKVKEVRQELVRISIGCVYSGRLPKLLSTWFSSLVSNLKNLNIVESVELVIIDNSNNDKLKQEVEKYVSYFKHIRIIKLSKRARYSDKNAVSTLLAEAYTTLLQQTIGEILFFLEDDITFSSKYQLQKLFNTLTYKTPLYSAVSGSYRNRHCEESLRISGYIQNKSYIPVSDFSIKETPIDIAGTGCLMFWRDLAPTYFEPFIQLHNSNIPAHDWWFTANMNSDRIKILQTDVKLKHWKTDKLYLI